MPDPDRADDEGSAPDDGGVIRAEFDWSAVAPSRAVIETVAIAADREPTVLEPLYETVDPEALDTLIRWRGLRSTDGYTIITFALDGHDVTVRSDGMLVVRPVARRSDSA